MNIFDEYVDLTNKGEWDKDLPIIKKIIELGPSTHTSWFNQGVCLNALGKHQEAANSFIKAYELNPDDYGAQYRIFRSLMLANDVNGFASFLKDEIKKTPEIIELLVEDDEFNDIIQQDKIQKIISM